MKPGFLFIPFIALLISAVSTAVGSSLPQAKWITPLGWASGAALIALWIVLDLENFKRFFTRKGAKYGASSGLVVVLAALIISGIAVLSTKPRFNKSYDVTRQKSNTLSDQSIKAIDTIKSRQTEIKATAYFVDQPVKDQFSSLISLYLARGASIQVEYLDPQRDPMRAKSAKITAGNTVIFMQASTETRITTFTEEKVTNAIVNVLKDQQKKIYFVKGHGEGQIKGTEASGFSAIAQELEINKFEVAELNLLEATKIPDDAHLLVISGPHYDFKIEETKSIEDFIKRGRPIFVMLNAMTQVPNLNNMLAKFGLTANNDLLVLHPDDPRAALLGANNAIVSDFDDFHPVSKDFARQSQVALMTADTRSISEVPDNVNGMKVTLVAKTAEGIIKVKDVQSREDLAGGKVKKERLESGSFAVIAVSSGKIPSPTLASASIDGAEKDTATDTSKSDEGSQTGKEVRIVLVGSAEFASNQGAQSGEHRDMFLNITNYLLQDEDFIAIRPRDLAKSTMSLKTPGSQSMLWTISVIYPLVFLFGGLSYWFRRRRL